MMNRDDGSRLTALRKTIVNAVQIPSQSDCDMIDSSICDGNQSTL